MELIDSDGKRFQLTPVQAAVFCQTDLGKQLNDDINKKKEVDFSSLKYMELKGHNVIRVLSHSKDPCQLTLTDEVMPEEVELLVTANGLGVPAAARHFAYRLWPLIQRNKSNPLHLTDWQKQGMRAIARPYAPCPMHMLEYLELQEEKQVRVDLSRMTNHGCFNLSSSYCLAAGYKYKFGTLAGLEALVRHIIGYGSFEINELVLDGHQLDTFSIKQIQDMYYLNRFYYYKTPIRMLSLRENCISELSEYQLDCSVLPADLLDLSDNPISSVTDGAFKAINRHRAGYRIRYNFHLSLERNVLSLSQKKELQKKFYNATHTIPERWTIGTDIATYKYVLALAPIIIAIYNNPHSLSEPASGQSESISAQKIVLGSLVLVWWWYLFVNRFDMRLAQISHPTIGTDWGGDIHDRSWAIWPKNEAKLLL